MKASWAVLTIATTALVSAQLVPFSAKQLQDAKMSSQSDMQTTGNLILSDILGSQRAISIFASWTRDITSVESRLESQSTNTTLLAPLNSALSALPRKPWEDPVDYDRLGEQAYMGNDGSERAAKNLERFVSAHIVPVSPWEEGERVKTLAGREIWWKNEGSKTVIMPDNIEVDKVAKRVGNGEVWIIRGVVNYSG